MMCLCFGMLAPGGGVYVHPPSYTNDDVMMPAKNNRSAGTLLQNPQEAAIITMDIFFLTNFTELELTNVQAEM